MGIFICKICQNNFDTILGLVRHSTQKHRINAEEIYVEYVLNGIKPKCECGCGQETKFKSVNKGYSRLVQSHHNRIPGKNNFHKNPETHKRAIETQKKNWKEGKYKGWWENDDDETKEKIEGIKIKLRNDKERGKKISKALKGVPKSEESKSKLSKTQKERLKNPNILKKMSETRLKWMRENSKVKTSKLEDVFSNILMNLGLVENVDFIRNYLIINIKTFFDFYFINKNIIIEVDGDFYHCNPNTTHKIPKYEIQKKNINNDKRKNTWCKNHNIKLIRYWEKDINERPEWVINDLKQKLGIISIQGSPNGRPLLLYETFVN